jgi:hypothetical protein
MELVCDGSRVAKPRASLVLEKNAQLLVYKWLKSLRFPNGHASNILRLVNTEECRLYGMKSHDCHVFMQTLIPLAFVNGYVFHIEEYRHGRKTYNSGVCIKG